MRKLEKMLVNLGRKSRKLCTPPTILLERSLATSPLCGTMVNCCRADEFQTSDIILFVFRERGISISVIISDYIIGSPLFTYFISGVSNHETLVLQIYIFVEHNLLKEVCFISPNHLAWFFFCWLNLMQKNKHLLKPKKKQHLPDASLIKIKGVLWPLSTSVCSFSNLELFFWKIYP